MRPPFLKKGDKVYLLSISRRVTFDLKPAVAEIESWGLQIVIGPTATGPGYCQFSASADDRLKDFQTALDDDSIKAVLFCRGGYGAIQIIDRVDFSRFAKNPKWLVGFSDITVVQSHVLAKYGIESIHAAMPSTYADASAEDLDTLRSTLFGQAITLDVAGMDNRRVKNINGSIIGGNLSILHTLIGTPSDMDTDGKILLIEDVNENLMNIERMLYAMKRAGKLKALAGLIVGDFTIPLKDNETSNSIVIEYPAPDAGNIQAALKGMIMNIVAEYDYPVCFGFSSGHEKGRNRALILGAQTDCKISSSQLILKLI